MSKAKKKRIQRLPSEIGKVLPQESENSELREPNSSKTKLLTWGPLFFSAFAIVISLITAYFQFESTKTAKDANELMSTERVVVRPAPLASGRILTQLIPPSSDRPPAINTVWRVETINNSLIPVTLDSLEVSDNSNFGRRSFRTFRIKSGDIFQEMNFPKTVAVGEAFVFYVDYPNSIDRLAYGILSKEPQFVGKQFPYTEAIVFLAERGIDFSGNELVEKNGPTSEDETLLGCYSSDGHKRLSWSVTENGKGSGDLDFKIKSARGSEFNVVSNPGDYSSLQ
jgi:hypothetical protein